MENEQDYELQEHPIYRVLRKRRSTIAGMSEELGIPKRMIYNYTSYHSQPSFFKALMILIWGKGEIQPEELLNDISLEEEIQNLKKIYFGELDVIFTFKRKEDD